MPYSASTGVLLSGYRVGLVGPGLGTSSAAMPATFRHAWPGQVGPNARFFIAYAYLLGGFTAFDHLGRFGRLALARRVFGSELVDDAVAQARKVLADWGYQRDAGMDPHWAKDLYGIHRAVAALGHADPDRRWAPIPSS